MVNPLFEFIFHLFDKETLKKLHFVLNSASSILRTLDNLLSVGIFCDSILLFLVWGKWEIYDGSKNFIELVKFCIRSNKSD